MKLYQLKEELKDRYKGILYENKDNNGLYLALDAHGITLFLPQKVGSIQVRKSIEINFFHRNIKCFRRKKNRVEDIYSIIDDWLSGRYTITSMQRKYDGIEIISGALLLEKDIKLYIKWKWEDMVNKPNQIDLLGYRLIFELLKNKETSKLFPVFHTFEGLSVSTVLNGRASFPFINYDEGQYLIHQRKKGKETIYIRCSWSDLYERYRNCLPERIEWAKYPDTFF